MSTETGRPQPAAELSGETTLARSLARATARFAEPTKHLYEAFNARILGLDEIAGCPQLPTFRDGLVNTGFHDAVRRSLDARTTCGVADLNQ